MTQYQAFASNPPRGEAAPKLVEPETPRAAAPAASAPGLAGRDGSEGKRGSGASKHLSETVRALRVKHDASTAIVLLDRHAVELERNGLAHEALILRVEALLNLGREREALRLLDRTSLTDVSASHSLLVTRGRLRAEANRCAEASAISAWCWPSPDSPTDRPSPDVPFVASNWATSPARALISNATAVRFPKIRVLASWSAGLGPCRRSP